MLTKIAPGGAAANFGISISIFRQRISSAVIPHPCLSDGAKGPTTFAAAGSRKIRAPLAAELHDLSIRAHESPILSVIYSPKRALHFSSTGVGDAIQIRSSELVA